MSLTFINSIKPHKKSDTQINISVKVDEFSDFIQKNKDVKGICYISLKKSSQSSMWYAILNND